MKTYTITIKEQDFVTYFGADGVDNLAEFNGYPGTIGNPDYVKGNGDFVEKEIDNPDYIPAVGSEKIIDPEWLAAQGENFDINVEEVDMPMLDNPDYVPAVGEPKIPNPEYIEDQGEPFMPNPDSKGAWLVKRVSTVGLNKVAEPYLVHIEKEYGRAGLEPAKAAVEAFKATVQVEESE